MTDTPVITKATVDLLAAILKAHPKRFVAENNFRVALTKMVADGTLVDLGDAEYSLTPIGLRRAVNIIWPQTHGRAMRPTVPNVTVIAHDQEYVGMLKKNQRYTITSARKERLARRMEAWGWVFALAILAGAAVAVIVL